jgi:uncharacterized protein
MTVDAMIDYEALQQEAMRGLVRSVLVQIGKTGLPGDHHLYISFDVRAPGVILSKRLREKYPNEMTIVLQHRFWDLAITDERFEVKLTFDGIPERLVVPFNSIKVFLDPSVRYVLHFEQQLGGMLDRNDDEPDDVVRPNEPRSAPKKPRASRAKLRGEGIPAGAVTLSSIPSAPAAAIGKLPARNPNAATKAPVAPAPQLASAPAAVTPASSATPPAAGEPDKASPAERGAQVLSLDAFRKK